MKTIFAAAVAALLLAPAMAQDGSGSKASQTTTHDESYFTKTRPITVIGEVVRMDKLPNGDVTVIVQTSYGRRTVILGQPDWYVRQYFKLRRGDRVDVSGFITDDGDVAASSVWRGSHKLFLRNEAGVPVWSTAGYATETQYGTMTIATYLMRNDFQDAMRKLWQDHVSWTRLFIVTAAADLPDKSATTERLLKNQADIGNAIKPYYGNDAGNKLTELLKEHILIAAEVVSGAKVNDKAKLDSANMRWFANADAIAKFLSDANPTQWKYENMRMHMHEHLKITTEEAVAQLKGDWSGSLRAYDKAHTQILGMADMLSSGIMAQFPARFSSPSTQVSNYGVR